MKKIFVALIVLGFLFITACSLSAKENLESKPDQSLKENELTEDENSVLEEKAEVSLAGIQLGATVDEVISQLGDNYEEQKFEDDGFFGEGYALWQYEGINLVVGLESQKVLQIDVYAPQFTTNLGDKVGDKAKSVLEKYRSKYSEYEGANSDGPLTGWFQVDENILVIFSFNEDRSRFNEDVSDDSKVEAITLAYSYFFH